MRIVTGLQAGGPASGVHFLERADSIAHRPPPGPIQSAMQWIYRCSFPGSIAGGA